MGWKENELQLEFELESNGSFGYRDGFCAHLGVFFVASEFGFSHLGLRKASCFLSLRALYREP